MTLPPTSGCRRYPSRAAFTLIELLVAITIIVILVGLIVGAAGFANTKASRSRAQGETRAISTAAENYKSDNGIYPRSAKTDALNARTQLDPSNTDKTAYTAASKDLYALLSGQVTNGTPVTNPTYPYSAPSGTRNYWGDLKPSMLGGKDSTGAFPSGVTAITDPWGLSYGYSTAYQRNLDDNQAASPPVTAAPTKGYNPTFDLWTTANDTSGTKQPAWITNW